MEFPPDPPADDLRFFYDLLHKRLVQHEQALVWAVGYLPPTCPGHFMHLLIEAKMKADKLNGV